MDTHAAACEILLELKPLAVQSEDGIYGDRARAVRDLDAALTTASNDQVRFLLAPTGNLQELALENGWGSKFNDFAVQLEKLLGII